jgi:hypothetical protein
MQLGKQPEPKKETFCNRNMGWGIFRTPHPHEKQKNGQLLVGSFLRKEKSGAQIPLLRQYKQNFRWLGG